MMKLAYFLGTQIETKILKQIFHQFAKILCYSFFFAIGCRLRNAYFCMIFILTSITRIDLFKVKNEINIKKKYQ